MYGRVNGNNNIQTFRGGREQVAGTELERGLRAVARRRCWSPEESDAMMVGSQIHPCGLPRLKYTELS